MRSMLLSALLVAFVTGCGSDPSGPTSSYAIVEGTYSGQVTGSNEFEQLSGTLSLTLTQDGEKLGGTYTFTGTVAGGVRPGPVSASGPVIGVIEIKGDSPWITMSLYEPGCGTHGYTALAGYESETRRFSIRSSTLLVCGLSDREYHLSEVTFAKQ